MYGLYTTHTFLERSRKDLPRNICVVALIVNRFRDKRKKHQCVFLRLSRNRSTINATTHTILERSRKDLSENVLVVALIVDRFRDKRQKHQHRRLNSYRGHYRYTN